jgi:hypothetical protein
MEEDFSPPLEASLRRSDSNRSWQGSSQTASVDQDPVDPKKLFLVSLETLVALFSAT